MILNTPDNFKSHLGQEAQLVEILNGIQQDVSEIHSIILVSSEGLPMASTRFDTSERDIVLSAMTAALINVAEQTSCELDKGDPTSLIIECPKGLILLRRINEDAVIAAITYPGAKLGIVLLALKRAETKILQVL